MYFYLFIILLFNLFYVLFLDNINVQKLLLKNKISIEYDPSNLRNLLQQLHKMDMDPVFSILDINYEVSF